MSMQQVIDTVRGFDGVLELAPQPGSEFPEIAWGDHFFYYSPDGTVPSNTQPYATIVTKDYPDDALSNLDPAGRWRLNIHVGATVFAELTGETPDDVATRDFSEEDVFLPHPVYGALGWVAVVDPGERTLATALTLLRAAHDDERRRVERRRSRAG
ncbi:DUF6194 family protein [Herbiconiux daphne]|uniref:DUF6194 family protein n=1 Tax=Herbiconiux daphne TaxID=2970914 RepID=A0ABT2GZS6_9MICO|nr:DUF6194 family protein [Herbiconiux daphne]MCS5733432.1 DUF6194 family protein [Herbiconiux daphne]